MLSEVGRVVAEEVVEKAQESMAEEVPAEGGCKGNMHAEVESKEDAPELHEMSR